MACEALRRVIVVVFSILSRGEGDFMRRPPLGRRGCAPMLRKRPDDSVTFPSVRIGGVGEARLGPRVLQTRGRRWSRPEASGRLL